MIVLLVCCHWEPHDQFSRFNDVPTIPNRWCFLLLKYSMLVCSLLDVRQNWFQNLQDAHKYVGQEKENVVSCKCSLQPMVPCTKQGFPVADLGILLGQGWCSAPSHSRVAHGRRLAGGPLHPSATQQKWLMSTLDSAQPWAVFQSGWHFGSKLSLFWGYPPE